MNNQNQKSLFTFELKSDNNELVIRHGDALPLKEPQRVHIIGTLDAPLQYLQKRIENINQKECNIIVNREAMSLRLIINEHSQYHDAIDGKLTLHPDFVNFGINSGKYKTPNDMAEFIKMNRSCFENRQEAMELVQQLRTFRAKIDKQVEAEDNRNKGDKKYLYNQIVDSNIPASFKVCIPIFRGTKKQLIELETYFNADDLTCTLVSPQANELATDYRDIAIDDVLNAIKEIAPEIVIIEQ